MTTRVLDSAYIYDFIDNGFNGTEIRSIIKKEADEFANLVLNEKLTNWEICFRIHYNHAKCILIYLKERSDKILKYKQITIHIPIPIKEKAIWGIDLEQHVYKDENHLDNLMKNFHLLEVDYSKFTNRHDYILDCMRRSIKFCFEYGFTVNGEKIKIHSPSDVRPTL